MSIIATGKPSMESSINAAFIKAKDDGMQTGADQNAIIAKLSSDIATAVDAYVTSITVMINPGIAVVATSTTGPVIGTTISPGSS